VVESVINYKYYTESKVVSSLGDKFETRITHYYVLCYILKNFFFQKFYLSSNLVQLEVLFVVGGLNRTTFRARTNTLELHKIVYQVHLLIGNER
jgi:hypothetical protein